ncbi:MAG: type II toxin-antitoxin system RelE/ParE family toxin [Desulfuromonadales bacterium]|jgi:toxin ParE1/3/4|nr:type II toxin-antitoxin system RelE/ParE family toxin [Desulfuromonadales bacterium]
MRHISISAYADDDLEAIGDYTEANWGVLKSEEYLDSITRCVEMLADNPNLGTLRSELGRDLYLWPHESHLIFYRFDDETIEIGRILHSSMDIALHLDIDPQ